MQSTTTRNGGTNTSTVAPDDNGILPVVAVTTDATSATAAATVSADSIVTRFLTTASALPASEYEVLNKKQLLSLLSLSSVAVLQHHMNHIMTVLSTKKYRMTVKEKKIIDDAVLATGYSPTPTSDTVTVTASQPIAANVTVTSKQARTRSASPSHSISEMISKQDKSSLLSMLTADTPLLTSDVNAVILCLSKQNLISTVAEYESVLVTAARIQSATYIPVLKQYLSSSLPSLDWYRVLPASVRIGKTTAKQLLEVLTSQSTHIIPADLISRLQEVIDVSNIVMTLFTEQADRAKAMGIFGFVLSGGGVAGVLLGGVLTDLLSWHWIFFINIPVGAAVFVALAAAPARGAGPRRRHPPRPRRGTDDHRLADARRLRDRERQRDRLGDRGDARAPRSAPSCSWWPSS